MNNNIEEKKKFINRYLDQRDQLPASVKEQLSLHTEDELLLYALIDLDESLRFCENWLLLTSKHVFIVSNREFKALLTHHFKITDISLVRETRSLSCSSLTFIKSNDQKALAKVHFTHRQKIIMGQIKYLCEGHLESSAQLLKGNVNADAHYQESALRPIREAQNSITSNSSKTLWRLLSYLLPYKKELAWGCAGACLTTIVSLVPAYLSGRLIDEVIRPFQDGALQKDEAYQMGWLMVASLAITYALREFFIYVRLNKMSILGEKVAKNLREELYAHLQTLSLDFFNKKQTGSIISRVSSDTDRIWDFVAFGVIEVGIALITLVGLSAVLITLDPTLGLIMAIPVPILLYSIYAHGQKMKKLFLRAWRKWSNVTSVLSDTIPGIQVVKAFGQENAEKARFNKRNEEVTNEFNSIHGEWTKFWPSLMLGFHTVIVCVWCFAIPKLITKDSNELLSAGTFVSFLLYMTMFGAPIEVLGQVARMLNRALSSAHRIFEVLDTNPSIKNNSSAQELKSLKGSVEFKDVFFSYDGVRPILNDLCFNVAPGEMIGLVGSSGGGKSTITKLIARFYDCDAGEILIDGKNVKELELKSFRKKIGMVLQEPYLFHGTIAQNIAYGANEACPNQIVEAAKIANAHNFIGRLSHGYDTLIGERGHNLSGGEKQRISIARAVLANPSILILDEATSAVDTETERKIQDALDKLAQGRTVFAIAHRLSTLRKADRIFVINKGSLVENGTHSELLSLEDGEYAKLHRMQRQMSEEFAL